MTTSWSRAPTPPRSAGRWPAAAARGQCHRIGAHALLVLALMLAPGRTEVRGNAPPGRYDVDAAADIVRDTKTGLTWQRTSDAGSYDWDQARAYCAALVLAGDAPWRVPRVKELRTLVDDLVSHTAPWADPTAFPDQPHGYYWSSTPCAGQAGSSWAVATDVTPIDATSLLPVRCVR